MDLQRRKRLIRAAIAAGLVLALVAIAAADLGWVSTLATLAAAAGVLLFLGWITLRVVRVFLWRVGRRLAFSYFLIGVLPIPMLLLLLGVAAYLLSSFFLGHLYRDAVNGLHHELELAAERRLAAGGRPAEEPPADAAVVYGVYREGRRVAGDPRTPATWPDWLPADEAPEIAAERVKESVSPYVALAEGAPGLAAAAGDRERGVVALFSGDLEGVLSERSDVWVELLRSDDPGARQHVKLRLGNRDFSLQPLTSRRKPEAGTQFFQRRARGGGLVDRPLLIWGELSSPFVALGDGSKVADYVVASLRGTPRIVHRHLFSSNAEVNTAVWAAMITVAFLLFDVYAVAWAMAVFMIYGLSRAVNRLSRATNAVIGGDFTVRIPVRRRDQVGELQRSFNRMAEHLQESVAAAAQKEAIEKELAIARELQQSLIPTDPSTPDSVEFATHFEPSAAIGGDYFDILRVGPDRLAVVVADVSGHGLSAGLRMAMLKAGLLILVEDDRPPEAILRRLDELVRSGDEGGGFVTATLAMLDFRSGELEITNAGHPPAYLLRGDAVEEILLPSTPLGRLGHRYAHRRLRLQPGDVVVWLSDGLIEATDAGGEPFGYERVVAALAGSGSPTTVRDRLLGAVRRHAADRPPEDDRTLVALRYRAAEAVGVRRGASELASASVSPSTE